MGICIHYRGQINDINVVDKLTDELEDFAGELGWGTYRWDGDWSKPKTAILSHDSGTANITGHAPLRGIDLTPHKNSERISLTFDPDGHLMDIMGMVFIAEGEQNPENSWVSVKTQFAPIDVHIAIIKLFQYLKKHYIHDLEVVDDGEFWETENVETLHQKRHLINQKMDEIEIALSDIPRQRFANKSPEEIADMVDEILTAIFRKKSTRKMS